MLTQILSSEKLKTKNSQTLENKEKLAKDSEEFSKIFNSLSGEVTTKNLKTTSSAEKETNVFATLEDMFQDDENFLKESFNFLKNKKEINLENEFKTETNLSSRPLYSLNFANQTIENNLKQAEEQLRISINKAKEFLRKELLKKSVPESEMPKTLRDLTKLAKEKGIDIKNIQLFFKDDTKTAPKIENRVATAELLNNHSVGLKVKKPDRPQNLTKMINLNSQNSLQSATETKASLNNNKVVDLASLLQATTDETTTDSKIGVDNNKKTTKNIQGHLKNLNEVLSVEEKKELKSIEAKKTNTSMAEKIGKKLNMEPEFVASLFSEDDLADLGIEPKKDISAIEDEVNKNHQTQIRDLTQAKTDLELKVHEAKTMTRHLAQNLKEQVENYRSPFQKMKLTLNPEKLGEVEVDILKRGNSVKITLSGNAQTMHVLSANSPELRNQLINVGLDNPTFKFNEDGRSGHQHQQQREQQEVVENIDEEDEVNIFEIDSLLIA